MGGAGLNLRPPACKGHAASCHELPAGVKPAWLLRGRGDEAPVGDSSSHDALTRLVTSPL